MADSHLCKLSLQLVFYDVFLEHHDRAFVLGVREEDCFRHAYVFHPCHGHAGSLEDFFVRHVVLPFVTKDGAQAVLVKPLQ